MFDGVILFWFGSFFFVNGEDHRLWLSAYTAGADAMLAPPSRLIALDGHQWRPSWLYIDMSTGNAGPIEALPRRIRTCRAFLFRVYAAHVSPQTRKGNAGGEQPPTTLLSTSFGTRVSPHLDT